MYVPRSLSAHINQLMTWFPVVSVTGPRQSGKSTLLQQIFPHMTYLNLEDPGLRALAREDPTGFIDSHAGPLIIDEVQNVPELFSAIQVTSDARNTPGQFILCGSQNFLLMEKITQSLAGRVGISHLLPFSFTEVKEVFPDLSLEDFALTGGYPRLHDAAIPPEIYFPNYVRSYIERDIRGLLNIRDAANFRRFLEACAFQAGNLINYSALANELDISFQTVKHWMSVLESSFIIFPLASYHASGRKSLTKTPKLYFYDTGLLCFLLGIADAASLSRSPHRGAVYENLVVAETRKAHLHAGRTPNLQFYRDDSKREVDLLDFTLPEPRAVEIKAAATYRTAFTKHLIPIAADLGITDATVAYGGTAASQTASHQVLPIPAYLQSL